MREASGTLGIVKLTPEMRKMLRELGRIGGKKGGKARAQRMTPGERREAARKAVLARWAQEKDRKAREG